MWSSKPSTEMKSRFGKTTMLSGKAGTAALADEAFLTSASQFVMPIVEIDGQRIGGGQPVANLVEGHDTGEVDAIVNGEVGRPLPQLRFLRPLAQKRQVQVG